MPAKLTSHLQVTTSLKHTYTEFGTADHSPLLKLNIQFDKHAEVVSI